MNDAGAGAKHPTLFNTLRRAILFLVTPRLGYSIYERTYVGHAGNAAQP